MTTEERQKLYAELQGLCAVKPYLTLEENKLIKDPADKRARATQNAMVSQDIAVAGIVGDMVDAEWEEKQGKGGQAD